MRVQLIGSGQTTVTNGSGIFKLESVICFGNQPLYVEAEFNQGYPHRYKVTPPAPPRAENRPSIVISEEQIHDWVGQLEGGISTESGLVIAAIPTVASAHEDKKPFPASRRLATDPTLVPETYTVSWIRAAARESSREREQRTADRGSGARGPRDPSADGQGRKSSLVRASGCLTESPVGSRPLLIRPRRRIWPFFSISGKQWPCLMK